MTDKQISQLTGVIGGTGLYQLEGLQTLKKHHSVNRWGEPSSPLVYAQQGDSTAVFLARHGENHNIPPHMVNYRANLWALKEAGVSQVIAVAAVGGISEHLPPASVVIPEQIIDYTYGRKQTYFEEELEQVTHIDFTEPYSEPLRQGLLKAATLQSINAINGGVYAATQGPRLETAAEIRRLKQDGADIVGMTGMPEAALAREIGLDYACCALVVNWAAGCAGTHVIDHAEMLTVIEQGMGQIHSIIGAYLEAAG